MGHGPPSSTKSNPPPSLTGREPRRVIVIDDTPAILEDFRKILCPGVAAARAQELDAMEASLFGKHPTPAPSTPPFELFTATQGLDGCAIVQRQLRSGRPIVLAFVDMRMPPGIDGVETAAKLLAIDPDLEIAICSAFSDYSWKDVIDRLHRPELRFLPKPFDSGAVVDLAWELTTRGLRRRAQRPRTG